MLSPIATEAIYSATYVDNYIDSVENLPDDVQRHLSRIRDIDVQYRSLLRDVDHYYDLWKTLQNANDATLNRRTRAIARMQQGLIQAQELGDEKMSIVNQLQELIDHKTRQLDTDQKNLDIKEDLQRSVEVLHQQDDCAGGGGPTPVKHSRTLSPARADVGAGSVNGGGSGGSSVGGGGGSTPNSERSGSGAMNGLALSAAVSGGGGGSVAVGGGGGNPNNSNLGGAGGGRDSSSGGGGVGGVAGSEAQRSANKRSRRRNDTVNNGSAIELGGNESNSANEGGGSNGGGSALQKSASSSSTQKKGAAQSQGGSAASGASGSGSGGVATANAAAATSGANNSGKKKKRKARGGQSTSAQTNAREETPPPDPIDPDEPTYCVCNQISFGEMILCDNDLCPIEWFHFSCVSLVLKPKGKWFCPNCRGDRPNVMKPKAQFLKELERYNKEKEEKT